MKLTQEDIKHIKNANIDLGEALYLIDGEIEVGLDGCQPSNSSCIAVGPFDYSDGNLKIEEIESSLA